MNSLPPSTSRRAAASAIRPQSSAIGGPAAYFSTLATRPSTGSLIPAFSSSAINHQPSVLGRCAAFTLIELLVVIAIIAILAGLAFPAVNGAITAARKAQARNDVMQIVAAIKAYQAEYGRLPTTAVAKDDSEEANKGWFGGEKNAEIIRVITGQNLNNLNPREISFLEAKTTQNRKSGIDSQSGVFYDPWGNPYFIKLDVSYNGKLEYYDPGNKENVFSSAMAGSFGPNGKQESPFAAGSDEIVSFK